ncbi:MAG: hypothetical protein PUE13_08835 [Clostridiales bacterium]|nr:hypothetical protein [Clostridiales bacterium]
MTKKTNVRSILLSVLAAVIAFIIIVAIAGFCYYRFYIMPKYNESVQQSNDNRAELTDEDILTFAKFFSNKQFLDNLKDFDKSTASDILSVLNEIETENSGSETQNSPESQKTETKQEQIPADVQANISKTAESANKKSAYDRIMAAADKDEIMAGMSIISKIDIAKVNKLQKEGKTTELKTYIKNTLSPSEISTSLNLYNKYKHLL